jgi:hypothetical protein
MQGNVTIMSQINLAKPGRKSAIRLLIGGGILVFILGNVLAAAITVNNGDTVNFGQGNAGITACASGIGYSVNSSFGGNGFQMDSILVTVTDKAKLDSAGSPIVDADGTTSGACDSKVMTVYAYKVETAITTVLGTMWVPLNSGDAGAAATNINVGTEIYTFVPAAATQGNPSDTPQYDSATVTPTSLQGLAFEITDN